MASRLAAMEQGLLRGIPSTRIKLIERIAAEARQRVAGTALDLRRRFLRAYFRGVGEEDLSQRSADEMARTALRQLETGYQRPAGRALVEVFNPGADANGLSSPHTVVMIVTEDMPFLVDSLGVALSKAGIAIHLLIHPVMWVKRDGRGRLLDVTHGAEEGALSESWQLYEVDRQTDATQIAALKAKLESVLADVRRSVEDWPQMRERVRALSESLLTDPPPLPSDEIDEAHALLDWMEARHFVFLGYRHYKLTRGKKSDRLVSDSRSGLGILRAGGDGNRGTSITLRGEVREHARTRELLILTKANSTATVHRGTYLDYVGVKTFGPRGEVTGEHRFLGLWTHTAYYSSPQEIPVLRKKVQKVVDHFALDPASHDAKAVLHVLETYPRDELFQASVADLVRISRGVVNLYERRTVRLLARRDPYHRFYSCLVYVPRDRYNTEVRLAIEQIVAKGFDGVQVDSQVQIADSNHARLHIVVRTDPNDRRTVDLPAIEERIAHATTTWNDRLRAVLIGKQDEASALALANRYRRVFPLAYEEDVDPADALEDLANLETLRADPTGLRLNLYRPRQQRSDRLHMKLTKLGEPLPISDILPMLENFGLRVISERPYELTWPEGGAAWIQDFELENREGTRVDLTRVEARFGEALGAALAGNVENDGFNRLLLAANLDAREIVVMRAYCKYLLQTGVPFSQASIERALTNNAGITQSLVRLFETSFDPSGPKQTAARADKIIGSIRAALDNVASLDEDRILRSYLNLVQATLRTNFYQPGADGKPKGYVSFKLDPQKIPDLPLPRPKFEIFVYSPRVEGVHLRMGDVARGGLRWSDRREDFRTEVLGLMKAQNVKNTVIVPVGAKGGFFPKRLPVAGTRDAIQAEGIACYQTFIRALLDITDNIVNGRIVPPARVLRRDGDDPYLVVAADKGTASFSDIANALSIEYGFWLGDAFASGGSAGYDHKKMGITARGGWECVKRHFREIGVDIQSQDFTASGIGDMSGDVFGNGMLLSKHMQLQAAFNHQHIFLDPTPDAASSFAERQRLFDLPRSSWDDYDRKKISRGGGVYSRSVKSILLSPVAQSMLGLEAAAAAPNEIIRAILRMPVDLLWNGGIGTYVKASDETNNDVGDRTNDAVRINGAELRAKVIGEGGNLGFSQRGRVEYALGGGRINTDFIDNSAGVNTSDVEVNIKILLNPSMQAGKLSQKDRDKLLARMTDEVAALVLRNNYLQSQAISTLEMQSAKRLAEYQHLIRSLERTGDLNRTLEFLPLDDELNDRRKRGVGLTRPELSVVLSYSKIWLSNHLLASDVPEDPYLSTELGRYFPAPVRERFSRAIPRHRLKREIITTATTNSLINRMGPTFVARTQEETGADPADIARAYTAAREIFDMRKLWARIEGLDNKITASLQYGMMYQTSRLLRHVTYWLLSHRRRELHIDRAVAEFRRGVLELEAEIGHVLVGADRDRFEKVRKEHLDAGAPAELASRVACLDANNAALDIVELATAHATRVVEAARVYFEVGARTGLDWMRQQVEQLAVEGPWQAVARTGLRDNALRIHRRLAERVLTRKDRGTAQVRVTAWVDSLGEELTHWQRTLADMRTAGAADFATLTVGVETVRKLAD